MGTFEKREIGGYLELEINRGSIFHNNAWALNSGRSCLEWVITAKNIRTIALPYFICDVVYEVCLKHGVKIIKYHVDSDFQPVNVPEEDCWLYLVNYYGTLKSETVLEYRRVTEGQSSEKRKIIGIIVDNTQAYYEKPIDGIYTLYTSRKYFGVPDGAFLYAPDLEGYEEFDIDKSAAHTNHLIGRLEGNASDYYMAFKENDNRLREAGIKRMSRLTENLLRGIDYEYVKERRTENYSYLNEKLNNLNRMNAELIKDIEGPFAYPLWVESGAKLREKLVDERIYVPILWPNILREVSPSTLEYNLAKNILPLPCDQRYGIDEMRRICEVIGR